MAIIEQKRTVTQQEAECRFSDLKLVEGVNLQNIKDVNQNWLDNYVKSSENEIKALYKNFDNSDAKRYEKAVKDRVDHVKHLCEIILSRK